MDMPFTSLIQGIFKQQLLVLVITCWIKMSNIYPNENLNFVPKWSFILFPLDASYMLDFVNRKHTKFRFNWYISFREIDFVINFNMQTSKCSMRIRFCSKIFNIFFVEVSG